MQQYILSKKNVIAVISGLLIALGFFSHFVLENVGLSEWSLIIASVFGITPIAIQAFQAVKVKVISIDVLVSIAAIGALFIQDYEESAIVTFLFLFGHYLEQRTLNQTRSAIKELTEMAPESALKQMDNGKFEEVEVDDVDEGISCSLKRVRKFQWMAQSLRAKGISMKLALQGKLFRSTNYLMQKFLQEPF